MKNYLLSFLLYGHDEAISKVGYTDNPNIWATYRVVIVPGGHLGKDLVWPDLSDLQTEQVGKTLVIHQDILYTTFFFLSRAEEVMNTQRDEHGRFLARYSILGEHNRLQMPLVDEYSRILMKALDLPLPENGFGHINLTHDIDILTRYRRLRGIAGGILKGHLRDVVESWKDINDDPAYTFARLVDWEKEIPNATSIYFVKQTHGHGFDYPQYCLKGCIWKDTLAYLKAHHAEVGIHSSYYGPDQTVMPPISTLHRSHFLRCSIEDMRTWAQLGITDDYTMGFADQIGFRMQTSRPFRWIDPERMEVTSLTIHPLLIMDCTLSNPGYMNLSEDEAYFISAKLMDKVRMHHGELTLLWHNHSLEDKYHLSLYPKILRLLL